MRWLSLHGRVSHELLAGVWAPHSREHRGRGAPSVFFIALCRLFISLFRLCSLRCGQRRMPCRLQTFLSTVVQTPSVAAGRAEGGVRGGVKRPQRLHMVWSFDVKKRTCDVDDGPVEQRRDLLNA